MTIYNTVYVSILHSLPSGMSYAFDSSCRAPSGLENTTVTVTLRHVLKQR